MSSKIDLNTPIDARDIVEAFALEAEARKLAIAGRPRVDDDGETAGTAAVRAYLRDRITARHAALKAEAVAIELVLEGFEGDKS